MRLMQEFAPTFCRITLKQSTVHSKRALLVALEPIPRLVQTALSTLFSITKRITPENSSFLEHSLRIVISERQEEMVPKD